MMISENMADHRFKPRGVVELHVGAALMLATEYYHRNVVLLSFPDEFLYYVLVLDCFVMYDYCICDVIVDQLKNGLFALLVY